MLYMDIGIVNGTEHIRAYKNMKKKSKYKQIDINLETQI